MESQKYAPRLPRSKRTRPRADTAVVQFRAGKGGDGCASLLRARHLPRGGPDGGDGGRGGDVTLVASPRRVSLESITRVVSARPGGSGAGRNRSGAAGGNVIIEVPVGTLVKAPRSVAESDPWARDLAREWDASNPIAGRSKRQSRHGDGVSQDGDEDQHTDAGPHDGTGDAVADVDRVAGVDGPGESAEVDVDTDAELDRDTDEEEEWDDVGHRLRGDVGDYVILADLDKPGARLVVARGGVGGKGNQHFKSPTNRAPREFTYGEKGEQRVLGLELSIIADVGLIGMPNAGKSTLLRALTRSDARTANYPFTTLYPNIGIAEFEDEGTVILADLPGIIRGAHRNVGLGHAFLRHCTRTRALAYCLDMSRDNPLEDFAVLREEVGLYDRMLLEKPSIVIANKMDVGEACEQALETLLAEGVDAVPVSALLGVNASLVGSSLRNLVEGSGVDIAARGRVSTSK